MNIEDVEPTLLSRMIGASLGWDVMLSSDGNYSVVRPSMGMIDFIVEPIQRDAMPFEYYMALVRCGAETLPEIPDDHDLAMQALGHYLLKEKR